MTVKVRSKFEQTIVSELQASGIEFGYESMSIKYTLPTRTYTPDIVLKNGIIIELKGYFKAADRQLHIAIKKSRPELDIRFVFMNAYNRLHKLSNTTYAEWCDSKGIKWAHQSIPKEWLI